MGQKVHPVCFRLSMTKDWGSRWYAKGSVFAKMLAEDIRVREYLKKRVSGAAISRILIERPAKSARVTLFSGRPGVIIGKKGDGLERIRADIQAMLSVPVCVNVEEVRKPELEAQIVSDSLAQQLEKRVMFRRAMKRCIQSAMRLGAEGIKIEASGRLNGIDIARSEWYREGRVPLQKLRADIGYGFSEAKTTYGLIGLKVWIFKGDRAAVASPSSSPVSPSAVPSPPSPRSAPDNQRKRSREGSRKSFPATKSGSGS
ncbi:MULTISPECIES: 30S ribosomal protein S3 [Candidatus Ichthyocystis]|uniref:Small ribosomal subunit protein uS3 n=1 Tax=Candidatus Ichthyocystis hellenicum TaxID=1561003 RepID=A0A0S4M2Z8_9BURK|nr:MULTISPECIES: 30S ribosomal protein S3 [Ichthyocystis]CUT17356.1 30S ribosomal protein S3 [Candidatus Ichthyocystis hellenicum]